MVDSYAGSIPDQQTLSFPYFNEEGAVGYSPTKTYAAWWITGTFQTLPIGYKQQDSYNHFMSAMLSCVWQDMLAPNLQLSGNPVAASDSGVIPLG